MPLSDPIKRERERGKKKTSSRLYIRSVLLDYTNNKAMWPLISALRRRRSSRVADDSGLGTETAGDGAAADASSGWSGALAALLAVARAPFVVAACAAGALRGGEEAAAAASWAARRPRPDDANHLMIREGMSYAIYV